MTIRFAALSLLPLVLSACGGGSEASAGSETEGLATGSMTSSGTTTGSTTGGATTSGGSTTGTSGGGSTTGTTGDGTTAGTTSGGTTTGTTSGGSTTGTTSGGPTTSGPLSMAYILDLTRWGGAAAFDGLDYSGVDYVIHAFYTADASTGALVSVDAIVDEYRNAGLVTKVHAAGKRIVMSLGGANHSFPLKQIAASPTLRSAFAANVVQKINEWGYDGVDLDLEFPAGGSEPQEHLALMTELYNAVKANNPEHLAMFGISPGWYIDQFLWSQLASVSDYGFYFCYDWSNPANGPMKNPGVNFTALGGASFEASCRGAMNYMIEQGYPADQIVVGLPFYANGHAHYADAPLSVKSATPDPDSMEAPGGPGEWWPNAASMNMKVDAVMDSSKSVLTGGATAAGVGWWEWGYEDPASPDLSRAIAERLGK